MEPRPLATHDMAEPWELARRDEGQRLVGRLEDLTAFVEDVAPCGLVAGDARVQHEVVVPAGDGDRIELDRTELAKDLQHGFRASRKRPRRREEVSCYEKPTRRLSSHLHLDDANPGKRPMDPLRRLLEERALAADRTGEDLPDARPGA